MEYLRVPVKCAYKQNTIIMDNDNRNVYKVQSCLDLGWLDENNKGRYYLVAKYLYTKELNEREGLIMSYQIYQTIILIALAYLFSFFLD